MQNDRPVITKELLEEARLLGKTQLQICKETGWSKTAMSRFARKFNIYFPKLGEINFVDLTNKRFNRWVAKRKIPKSEHKMNTHASVWECVCDCGKIKNIIGTSLTFGSTQSCGCYKSYISSYGYEDIDGTFWSVLLTSSRAANRSMEICIKDLWDIYVKQNKRCNLSGEEISFRKTHHKLFDQTASVDRIDPKKDYTIDNIQIVHKDINMMKSNLDNDKFIEYCKSIFLFDKNLVMPIDDFNLSKPFKTFKGHQNLSGTYWTRIKIGAEDRGLEFSIKIEDVWQLYLNQGGLCNISGREIIFSRRYNRKYRSTQTASIDRIDNSKGYIEGNIQIIHKDLNRMKSSYDNEYFINTLKKIGKYQLDREDSHVILDVPLTKTNRKPIRRN